MVRTTEKMRKLRNDFKRQETIEKHLKVPRKNSVFVEADTDGRIIKKLFEIDLEVSQLITIWKEDKNKKGKKGIIEKVKSNDDKFYGFVDMDHEFDLEAIVEKNGITRGKIKDTNTSCCLFMMVTQPLYKKDGWKKFFRIIRLSDSSVEVLNLNNAKDKLKEHWNEVLSISERFTWNKLFRATNQIKPPIKRDENGQYIVNNLEEIKIKLNEFELEHKEKLTDYIEKNRKMLGAQHNDHEFATILYHWLNTHSDLFSFVPNCKTPKGLETFLVDKMLTNQYHKPYKLTVKDGNLSVIINSGSCYL